MMFFQIFTPNFNVGFQEQSNSFYPRSDSKVIYVFLTDFCRFDK